MSLPVRLALVAVTILLRVGASGVFPAVLFAVQVSGVRDVAPDTTLETIVNPRTLVGGTAVIVTGLLLLLYFYRRRVYILYWMAGWMLAATSMFLAAPAYEPEYDRFAFGLSQFLGIVSALVFVVSADAYRAEPHLRRGHALVLLPVFLWFAMAPLALEMESVFAPGHLLIAGGLAAAGVAHMALLRHSWLLGAALVGTTLLLLATLNVWLALGVPDLDAAVNGRAMYFNLALYLVTALGMQLMTFEDMTYELRVTNKRLEVAQEELREMVTTDSLTGCRNRRFFDEIIHREVERHSRYRIPLSLLFVDVNRFKAINDTLGHEAGDRVLQRVAAFLIKKVREADYVFRWGGDEFLILISCTEGEALRKGADLQAAFAASDDAAALPRGVGLSVGCAEVPKDAKDVHALVKVADERMYVNKRSTK
jgi:diguanylate cyclase (GGDEF)-like protein